MEKRRFKRFKPSDRYRAKLIFSEDTRIKNISLGGILLETTKRLNINNYYRIQITSLNKESAITPLCTVARSFLRGTTDEGNDTMHLYEVALEFIKLNDSEKLFLKSIMSGLAKKTAVSKNDM